MKKARNTSADAAELRRRAIDRLRATAAKGTPAQTELEAQRLVHEAKPEFKRSRRFGHECIIRFGDDRWRGDGY